MSRKLDDWLSSYIDYTSEQESPSIFHLWCGLSIIASTLDRKVWLDRGYYTLYPNLYVILIAGSARCRKSTAIGIAEKILRMGVEDIFVISQKITMEALINILSARYVKYGKSVAVAINDEVTNLLGKGPQAEGLIGVLTKLYDCTDFDYTTLSRKEEKCIKPMLNMLGATTPSLLKSALPAGSIGGGFTSRVMFVYQKSPEKLVPSPRLTKREIKIRDKLVSDLKDISSISGEYQMTDDAVDWYETWYVEAFKPEKVVHASLDGYYGRKHDSLLKLAMLYSASRGSGLVIKEAEIRMAMKTLGQNEKNLPQTLDIVDMSDEGEDTQRVYKIVKSKGTIEHSHLLRHLSYRMNARRIEEIMSGLIASERVILNVKKGKRFYASNSNF